jgi:hypothetical protein
VAAIGKQVKPRSPGADISSRARRFVALKGIQRDAHAIIWPPGTLVPNVMFSASRKPAMGEEI